jgi:hypothetical protein
VSQAAPFVWVVVGSPGSGKSSLIRIALEANQPRRLIFDPMGEFAKSGARTVANLDDMRKTILTAGAGPFSLNYQPDTSDPAKLKQKFDVFCKLAFAAGDLLLVVDEAADVTSPNRYEIPEGWSTVLRQGRHRSLRILAATQRPADIDKRLWTFATRIRTGRLNYSSDQSELANVLNVDRAEIAGLIERQWIERDMLTGQITRGSIEWVGKGQGRAKPVQVPQNSSRTAQAPAEPVGRGRHRAVNPALGDAAPNRVAPARRGNPIRKKKSPKP